MNVLLSDITGQETYMADLLTGLFAFIFLIFLAAFVASGGMPNDDYE